MEFSSIDLTLAVNYLPAVECVLKSLSLSCVLCWVHVHLGAFPVLALALNINRTLSNFLIFDGNAVQYSVLLSWFINILRLEAVAPAPVLPIASFLWIVSSFLLVVEPTQVQEFLLLNRQGNNLRQRLRQTIPAIANSFFIGCFIFLPFASEPCLFRVARSMAFASLCVTWVYVVAVWRPNQWPIQGNGCHALLARFSPVLYVHAVLAVVYFALCVGSMVYHHVGIHVVSTQSAPPKPAANVSQKSVGVVDLQDLEADSALGTITEEDEDLEALLRSAKQQQRIN